ncbi:uncharacterized protein rab11fip1a [Diretmus argenteus]
MSLAEQSQQWFPTSVQVTVHQARNLRVKGKNGTNDAYAIIQVSKDKFSTSVAERCVSPAWKEEASFDLPLFHPSNAERCTLHIIVMHRSQVGLDKFLGQAVVNLLELHDDKSRKKSDWFKLVDKSGKEDKARGDVLLDIQFLRNNLSASMFDLSMQDKPRSRISKLRDKVRGKRKDGFSDSASAIVPSVSQVLTDSEEEADARSLNQSPGMKKKSKLKSLFAPKSNLQRNVSQSMSTLGTLPEKNSSLSGSRSSGLNADSPEVKKKFKFLGHKRTGSNDSKASQGPFSLLGRSKQSASDLNNLCINGSHVYTEEAEPQTGSTLSLNSSGQGSAEDVCRRNSDVSVDSLKGLSIPSYRPESTDRAAMEQQRHQEEEERRQAEEKRRAEAKRLQEEEAFRAEAKRLREEEERKYQEEQDRRRRFLEDEARRKKQKAEEEEEEEEEAERRKQEEERRRRMEAAENQRLEEERCRLEEQQRQQEEARRAEEQKRQEEEARRAEEQKRQQEEARRAEEQKRQEEASMSERLSSLFGMIRKKEEKKEEEPPKPAPEEVPNSQHSTNPFEEIPLSSDPTNSMDESPADPQKPTRNPQTPSAMVFLNRTAKVSAVKPRLAEPLKPEPPDGQTRSQQHPSPATSASSLSSVPSESPDSFFTLHSSLAPPRIRQSSSEPPRRNTENLSSVGSSPTMSERKRRSPPLPEAHAGLPIDPTWRSGGNLAPIREIENPGYVDADGSHGRKIALPLPDYETLFPQKRHGVQGHTRWDHIIAEVHQRRRDAPTDFIGQEMSVDGPEEPTPGHRSSLAQERPVIRHHQTQPEEATPEEAKPSSSRRPEEAKPTATRRPEEAKPEEAKPSSSRRPEEAKPTATRRPEEAKPTATRRPEEATPSSSRRPEEAKPSSSRRPEEAKPSSSRRPEEAKPSSSRRPEEAKPEEAKPSSSRRPEEAKPTSSRRPEEAKPTATRQPEAKPEEAKPSSSRRPEETKPTSSKKVAAPPPPKTVPATHLRSIADSNQKQSQRMAPAPPSAVPGSLNTDASSGEVGSAMPRDGVRKALQPTPTEVCRPTTRTDEVQTTTTNGMPTAKPRQRVGGKEPTSRAGPDATPIVPASSNRNNHRPLSRSAVNHVDKTVREANERFAASDPFPSAELLPKDPWAQTEQNQGVDYLFTGTVQKLEDQGMSADDLDKVFTSETPTDPFSGFYGGDSEKHPDHRMKDSDSDQHSPALQRRPSPRRQQTLPPLADSDNTRPQPEPTPEEETTLTTAHRALAPGEATHPSSSSAFSPHADVETEDSYYGREMVENQFREDPFAADPFAVTSSPPMSTPEPLQVVLEESAAQAGALSGGKMLLRAWVSPSEVQSVNAQNSSGGGAASVPRRPHPVKPMSSAEIQHPTSTPAARVIKIHDNTAGKAKVSDSVETGPYTQLTQEELITLVVKQQAELSKKDAKIIELEEYIDKLLVRVIEEQPSILLSLSSGKPA